MSGSRTRVPSVDEKIDLPVRSAGFAGSAGVGVRVGAGD
jgi:hypothetical protein